MHFSKQSYCQAVMSREVFFFAPLCFSLSLSRKAVNIFQSRMCSGSMSQSVTTRIPFCLAFYVVSIAGRLFSMREVLGVGSAGGSGKRMDRHGQDY